MIPDKNIKCHRTGFTKTCASIVGKGQCRLWMQLQGANPQTGERIDKWGCADELLPFLLIENSQMQRQTGAAVESFRNQMVKANNASLRLALTSLQRQSEPRDVVTVNATAMPS